MKDKRTKAELLARIEELEADNRRLSSACEVNHRLQEGRSALEKELERVAPFENRYFEAVAQFKATISDLIAERRGLRTQMYRLSSARTAILQAIGYHHPVMTEAYHKMFVVFQEFDAPEADPAWPMVRDVLYALERAMEAERPKAGMELLREKGRVYLAGGQEWKTSWSVWQRSDEDNE